MWIGRWVISGQALIVTLDTQIEGTPRIGLKAEVEALLHVNAALQAVKITIKG